MKRLSDQAGVSILVDAQALGTPAEYEISLGLREGVTLIQVFQALADQNDICFIMRDYGIMVTSEGSGDGDHGSGDPVHPSRERRRREVGGCAAGAQSVSSRRLDRLLAVGVDEVAPRP